MLESIHFMYDNISSKDMGVNIAWSKGGLFEENFLPSRKIIERKVANNEKPYFQRVEHEPLSFQLSFYLENWVEDKDIRKIARWLFQPYYKPLVFDSNPNRVIHALIEGNSALLHNGLKQGYVELSIRCDSPYTYSQEQSFTNLTFRDANTGYHIIDDSHTFAQGELINTKVTSNGLTIDNVNNSWGILYANTKKWGEL
ncbi:phage tail domain-containing protein [Lysinibacillus sp. FSL H8-0500]|uniref:phage tail domain-containing protein n=1 Tax=Lysinibacillus sp. FSL H8-0500 TaxID=2921393 RepID=UPI0031018844